MSHRDTTSPRMQARRRQPTPLQAYANAQVYMIWCTRRPETVYIGSTTRPLAERLSRHRIVHNFHVRHRLDGTYRPHNTTSAIILDLAEAPEDVVIEQLEHYPCRCRHELQLRERMRIMWARSEPNMASVSFAFIHMPHTH